MPPEAANKLDLRGIWAWDAQHAVIVSSGPGDLSRLYETTDGCAHWKLILTNPAAHDAANPGFWDGILFLDHQDGLIYGDPVRNESGLIVPILRTADAGKTWTATTIQALPGESAFAASNSSMAAIDGQIWLGTSKSRVLRSSDGVHWESAPTPLASGNDSSGVFSVGFRDREHGMAVGGDYRQPEKTEGTAAYTKDGGKHWTAAVKPPHGFRSAVAWDAKSNAWIAVGTNGSDISYDDGKTWQWLDSGNWNALSLPWAVGPHGQIGKLGKLPAPPPAPSR